MKCMHCGADLPEDQLICPSCGREIQIVPDYNPLDDMLTAQLKGGITQTMSVHLGEQEKQDVSYSGAANPVWEKIFMKTVNLQKRFLIQQQQSWDLI